MSLLFDCKPAPVTLRAGVGDSMLPSEPSCLAYGPYGLLWIGLLLFSKTCSDMLRNSISPKLGFNSTLLTLQNISLVAFHSQLDL